MSDESNTKEIHREAMYPHAEVCRRLGWGKAAYRAARSRGLIVSHVGNGAYIYGGDLIEYIRQEGRKNREAA